MSALKIVFACSENFENHHAEKLTQISEICKENICGRVSLKSNHFFAVHSNFTYDSEAYDLMKLYFPSLLF